MANPNKIRILFIIPRYASIRRGVESFAKDLISRLDASKFEIFLFSDLGDGKQANFLALSCTMVPREKMYFIDRLPAIVRRVFNTVSLGSASDIEAFTLYLASKKKYRGLAFDLAVPLGGYWTYLLANKLSKRVISIGESGAVKRWLRLSDFFVSLTPADLAISKGAFPNLPCKLIPNGVDTSKFEIKLTGSFSKRILCVAALVEDKRHRYLLDALLHLPSTVELLCIGSGVLQQQLTTHPVVKSGRVTFKSVPYEEIPSVYSGVDVFTLPSLDEAFGIVFIEAMAAGLPIVAHDGPRQRFVIGNNGFYCDTNDAKAYAVALEIALKTPKRQEVRDEAIKRYSWDNILIEYTKVFEEVAS